jgi:hypothetical protein
MVHIRSWGSGLASWLVAVAALAALCACAGPGAGAPVWVEGATRDGRIEVLWRAEGGRLEAHRITTLDVELRRDGRPFEGVQLAVSAWMPDHGHGTNLDPATTELGAGRYRVEGVLLHMPGLWELFFDVVHEGRAARAGFELEL